MTSAYAPPPAYTYVPPGSPTPSGAHGAIMRVRARSGVCDLVCYPEGVVVSRVDGIDPALAGALIGLFVMFILGAVVGGIIGEHLARAAARDRIPMLQFMPAGQLVARHRRNLAISRDHVRVAHLVEYGGTHRRLDITMHDGTRHRFSFSRGDGPNVLAPSNLAHALGPELVVERKRYRPAVAALGIAIAAVVALIVVALAVGG